MSTFRPLCFLVAVLAWSGAPALADEAAAADPAQVFRADCAQCHGRVGRGMASFPSVRGRTAEYLTERLNSYRAGEAVGPNSMLMFPVAEELSDDDIEMLANFMSETFQ